jgi:hypothetical protein
VTHVHRSAAPDHRVLLVDSRRDGLPPRTEDAIANDLRRMGLEVDLDAISDPRSILRVLNEHPHALDGYDAVVAVAPLRADWRGSSRTLTQVLQRVDARTATLLVDRSSRISPQDGSLGADAATSSRIHRLLLPTDPEPISVARQISTTLRVLLDRLEEDASPVGTRPAVASDLREDIGARAVGRLERIVQLARDTFGQGVAEVNLVHGDFVVTVASAGAQPRALPADDSLCTIALRNAGVTVMTDTWLDPDACRRTPTQEPDAVRFYAGFPVRSSTGEAIGMLCVWDFSPHEPEELDIGLLRDLALLAEGELIHA